MNCTIWKVAVTVLYKELFVDSMCVNSNIPQNGQIQVLASSLVVP